ncbi:MAG: hypothetical protein CR982_01215 [Candidatus Cloacimonadota bacterium]|nr:MAG: hypothetical protein CR982_01215 [Candidatus Cloacimonadota bacterium]PIE81264.1 MAG: hypothetical protein CSA15_00995 [Candidatus Delongbacteria bacterium]
MRPLLIALLIMFSISYAEYSVGDIVENFNFQKIIYDQSGNPSITRTNLYDEIDEEGKPLIVYFFDITFS